MGADTSVVKKKHEWNRMAGEEEWMEKHRDMEGEGKTRWTPTWAEAQDARTNSYSLETHLVKKWGDTGHQRAVGQGFIRIRILENKVPDTTGYGRMCVVASQAKLT